ncbi:MAG: serine/threonine protein kinase [Planctomycetes bacterium]|nr:serine/threonine protein kinase [Planctomycetota bacterium]
MSDNAAAASRHERARLIFALALDKSAADRAAFLQDACGNDHELRQEIESLLQFDRDSGDLLNPPTSPTALSNTQPTPDHIGHFRIIRLIGAGGMGDVYEAEQLAPRRRVALKVMRRGPRSTDFAKRFEREAQIQASLTHPGIAAVYETGVDTSSGAPVPFLAMELVEGVPLLEFARRNELDVAARLSLMLSVCDALSYAHQRGVIHRDLKPDNILVQQSPQGPRPQVLDFGVAKFTESGINHALTTRTQVGQLIGTLSYMSPEQLSGRTDEVDTLSDVYALGVVLYQLLSGQTCHATRDMPLPEAIRFISENEPTRITVHQPALRGDIETIVHKAIERDKTRRYASASELAADIRRYLNNEPIAARPATLVYQISKFTHRHRGLVTATGLVIALLVAGIAATSYMAIAANRAREVAERKTSVAEGVSDVLLSALTTATPKVTPGKEPLLIDAIKRIESQTTDASTSITPEVQAVILNIVGIIYRERGDFDSAEQSFTKSLEIRRRVLDPHDPNIADTLNNLGLIRKRQDRFAEAAEFYRQAVEIQRSSSFKDDVRLARNLFNLANAYISASAYEQAKPLLAEAHAMHLRLPRTPEILGYYVTADAKIAMGEGRWQDARALAEKALAMQREAVGETHPTIASCLADLGEILVHLGETDQGLDLLREADAMSLKVFPAGPLHPIGRGIRARLVDALRKTDHEGEIDRLPK